jgi:hypothetical protein
MTTPRTVEQAMPWPRRRQQALHSTGLAKAKRPALARGRVPRIARLLALALHFEELLQRGTVQRYAALARLGHVSRARITQIMNLRCLAPDIQEQILFLAPTLHGRDCLTLAQLQTVAAVLDWPGQRRLWQMLLQAQGLAPRSQPCAPECLS